MSKKYDTCMKALPVGNYGVNKENLYVLKLSKTQAISLNHSVRSPFSIFFVDQYNQLYKDLGVFSGEFLMEEEDVE